MHLRIFNDFKTAELPPSSATSLKSYVHGSAAAAVALSVIKVIHTAVTQAAQLSLTDRLMTNLHFYNFAKLNFPRIVAVGMCVCLTHSRVFQCLCSHQTYRFR